MVIALLCILIAMGLVQVLRPQMLWRVNHRPLQQPFVKGYVAAEPTSAGYTTTRLTGAVFLAVAVLTLIAHIS
ncbi:MULTISPECIES: DUF6199 family natural product biosynthesis protein [Streptomyces]|uniref:DUF6199 family natural product biosynthesis protein n=1 Tax=Streptomyces lateritius TaxID=67313 RepID=A0ABW6YGA0_9ACTN|nr:MULTISPECIES: DUF6199 family natural product biosynthesis protein [Streptomyces]QGZ47604.1 hypothetical protein GPZ77_03650 [Streptomyces sp. QHH-9511]GGT78344.1 hypothetical protein GCM10010272_22430 [Streptomyces lateritius]